MNRIKDLKIYKRLLALLSASVMSLTSLPALALETEKETVDNKENVQVVDEEPTQIIPLEQVTDEEEIHEYNTMDEYLESCENSKEGLSTLIKKSGISKIQCNDMLYLLRAERCLQIRDELVKNGIISEKFWDSYDNGFMAFLFLCDAACKKGDSDKLINVLPEEYREDYEEAFNIFIRTAIKSPLAKGKITPEVTKSLSDLSNIFFADEKRGGKLPQVCMFFDSVLWTFGDYAVRMSGNQANNPKSEVYRFAELNDNFDTNANSIAEEFCTSEAILASIEGARDK